MTVGEQARCVGAEFDGAINLGPLCIHIMLSFSEWKEKQGLVAKLAALATNLRANLTRDMGSSP